MARIDDGFPTFVNVYDDENEGSPIIVQFWEKTITPPGVQAGGANDTTTMRNIWWRSMAPKKLLTLSEMTATVAYDPELYDTILSLIQEIKWYVIIWPDTSRLGFWGFLDEFTPNEITEGEQPDADITIVPSNFNDEQEERPPVYSAGSSS